ncbi:MAG: FAD-dependent oxidoreductase [Flavobacteriia bacterium]|nr:FAD-dependent oxidoreductase [Flavobacteriia bacterium]
MSQFVQFQVTPEQAKDQYFLKKRIEDELNLSSSNFEFIWRKRSIDARKSAIKINCTFEVYLEGEQIPTRVFYKSQNVKEKEKVAIIGSGPAGLFAALHAIELGLCPIIFERGKDVRSRRRDLAKLNKDSIVNPESNYCFGEGGAGTYSDGKLYTRSKKRGDVLKALEWFVHFGADKDILVDAHPHIGTNKLPHIIVAIREEIIKCGGEVHFENKLTNIFLENKAIKAIELNGKNKLEFKNVVLATGHSARDVFELLHAKGLRLEAKPFALGVRVEHSQAFIDKIQYSGRLNDDFLPPASYSLVSQINGKGVYSFCMCPGGIIAPCATSEGEVVTNGWSPSKRNNPYSNSGIVVTVEPEELPNYQKNNPFVALDFQKSIEKACWEAAGRTQKVPAQRLKDFVDQKISKDFPRSSYVPGIVSIDINTILPDFIASRLRKGFVDFDKKMKGFLTNDAVVHAPESRTSSPIQIPRDSISLMHPDCDGLYPCAEGAGYAGGIISAGIDGMKSIDAIYDKINGIKE